MHITFTTLINETKNKVLLHRGYIKVKLNFYCSIFFLGPMSLNSFAFKPFFKENIVPYVMAFFHKTCIFHLLSDKYPVLSLATFKDESMDILF